MLFPLVDSVYSLKVGFTHVVLLSPCGISLELHWGKGLQLLTALSEWLKPKFL